KIFFAPPPSPPSPLLFPLPLPCPSLSGGWGEPSLRPRSRRWPQGLGGGRRPARVQELPAAAKAHLDVRDQAVGVSGSRRHARAARPHGERRRAERRPWHATAGYIGQGQRQRRPSPCCCRRRTLPCVSPPGAILHITPPLSVASAVEKLTLGADRGPRHRGRALVAGLSLARRATLYDCLSALYNAAANGRIEGCHQPVELAQAGVRQNALPATSKLLKA
ncbi:unnamed protein product, partial [Urochloa humidicola]